MSAASSRSAPGSRSKGPAAPSAIAPGGLGPRMSRSSIWEPLGPSQAGTFNLTEEPGPIRERSGDGRRYVNLSATAWSNTGLISETNSTHQLWQHVHHGGPGQLQPQRRQSQSDGHADEYRQHVRLDSTTGDWNIAGGTILAGPCGLDRRAQADRHHFGWHAQWRHAERRSQTQPVALDITGNPANIKVPGDLNFDNVTITFRTWGRSISTTRPRP